ncbi:hypothetical protein [Sporosarcina ureae]|nr:hypothetical protein [Sporosarcina ureae]
MKHVFVLGGTELLGFETIKELLMQGLVHATTIGKQLLTIPANTD